MTLKKAINFLACPYCRGNLFIRGRKIVCRKCKKDFSVIKGVPILTREDVNKQEKNQEDWFNKHYSQFSKTKYKLENWRQSMLNRIFGLDQGKKIKTYLDIGCGATGYTVIEAAKKNGWVSFGVDISYEAMARAKFLSEKQGVEDKTFFVVCSAENLPFRKSTFDYVSAISLLEHLENDWLAVKSVFSILKKPGYFYICVPNTYKRMWPFLWPVYFYIDKMIGHKRHYSIESLSRLLKKNGNFVLKEAFYNCHLIKLFQLVLAKVNLINNRLWWKMENLDINGNFMGIQLNAIYQKK